MSNFREIFKIIEDEKQNWMNEHKEEKVRKMVRDSLDASNVNTLLKICGFEMEMEYWKGKAMPYWKVDHCNNRSGNSLIGNIIKDAVGGALTGLIVDFDKLEPVEIDKLKKAAKSAYIKQYERTVRKEAQEMAEKHAKEFIQRQIDIALEGDAEKVRLLLQKANG